MHKESFCSFRTRRIRRDGWEDPSSQRDVMSPGIAQVYFHTQKRRACSSLLQITFYSRSKSWKFKSKLFSYAFACTCPQKSGSLTCIKRLSSQSWTKDRGLMENLEVIYSLTIHAVASFTAGLERTKMPKNLERTQGHRLTSSSLTRSYWCPTGSALHLQSLCIKDNE